MEEQETKELIEQNDELKRELSKNRVWLQELLCVMLNGMTFEGFLMYCDAYDLDAEELLANEAKYCEYDPIEVDWSVAMARDIWQRGGFQDEQNRMMVLNNA